MSQSARAGVAALSALLALATAPGATDAPEEWQDPAVSGRNREPAHATMLPYATVEQALEGTREASPFFLSLKRGGGRGWKFHYVAKPADRPRDFYRTDFDDRAWPEIKVPVELAAAGLRQADLPEHALPVGAREPAAAHHPARLQPGRLVPHDVRGPRRLGGPPGVPALRRRQQRVLPVGQRPVGRLQRGQHDGRRVRRHAVPAAGARTSSPPRSSAGRTAATSRTRTPGASAASTATCSSTRPRLVHIADFAVRTDLDEDYRDATLLVRPRLRSHDGATAEGFTVEAQLFDADGRPVLAQPLARDAKAILDEKYPQRDTNPFGLLEAKVKAPRLWSAETPYLYTLVLSAEGRRRAPSWRRRARGSASARSRSAASGSS